MVFGQRQALSIPLEKYKQQESSAITTRSGRTTRSSNARATNGADAELIFQCKGTTLDLTKTPADYNLAQGDRIDVFEATASVMDVASSKRAGSSKRKKSIEI